jgi:hypothetical protein
MGRATTDTSLTPATHTKEWVPGVAYSRADCGETVKVNRVTRPSSAHPSKCIAVEALCVYKRSQVDKSPFKPEAAREWRTRDQGGAQRAAE